MTTTEIGSMRGRRILTILVAGCVVLVATWAAVMTAISVIASVHGSTIDIPLRFNQEFGRNSGIPGGVRSQAIVTQTIVAIRGLSPLTVGLHITGGMLAALAPLTLAWFAVRLGVGLWRGRPFAAPVARDLVVASAVMLGLTMVSQLVLWLSRITTLTELPYVGSGLFSWWPEFDPLLTVPALGLLIVAIAVRLGSRADRLTEGLV